jgi:Transposase DDE domain
MLKFYQTHLKSQLSASDYIFLQILINVLQALKKVSIEALANALPIPITFESRRKKLQRFLSLPNFTIKDIWTVIVKEWLSQTFEREEVLRVAIDRTSWGLINILMVAVVWEKRSIPIYFEFLEKLGSSNLAEQTAILSKAIEIFKDYKICVLGDREFCSVKLANWLSEKKISFCLRLKKTNFVEKETGIWVELNELGLLEGISIFLEGVKVTKTKNIKGFNVACKWKRKVSGFSQKEGWFILTDLTLKLAIDRYRQRFDIEEMFRDFKTGGYNLESTKVSGERLTSLLLLISLAYLSATIEGQLINQKGIQKYVGRVKETGRTERRHSCFYVGLYGHTWVNFVSNCGALVEELLRLSPNKLTYYQRGKRAMQLVTATF